MSAARPTTPEAIDVYEAARTVRGEVDLCVTDHGPADGIPVLMLHGWPDSARLWRNQIPGLVDGGYRVLAPDLRGFGRSAQPGEVEAYHLRCLAADVAAILDDAHLARAHVVGHDFGSALAWYVAITMPDRVQSLTAISVGHPTAFQTAGYRQLEKSWYTLLFQFHGVAEEWLSANDWAGLKSWTGSNESTNWMEDLSRPGRLTASLNLYRANLSPRRLLKPPSPLPSVAADTLGIWSSDDLALTEEQMTGSERHVSGEWRYQRVEDVSHWVPLDAPGLLNDALLGWLGRR